LPRIVGIACRLALCGELLFVSPVSCVEVFLVMARPPLNYLYLDDSGTRNPDWEPKAPSEERDSFCTGGVIIREEDKETIRAAKFCSDWKITYPLHIRPKFATTRKTSSGLRLVAA
jgi:hypothetical protein